MTSQRETVVCPLFCLVAETPRAHVLLETVALAADEDQPPAGFGRPPEDGDPAWRQQPELLAHGANPGPSQCLAGGARPPQRQGPVVLGTGPHGSSHFVERANSLNRPLRTRTVGGVRAGGEKPLARFGHVRYYACRSLRPRPSAMNVTTKLFSDTPSAFARAANRAWTVFGTRATNFPDATPRCSGLELVDPWP